MGKQHQEYTGFSDTAFQQWCEAMSANGYESTVARDREFWAGAIAQVDEALQRHLAGRDTQRLLLDPHDPSVILAESLVTEGLAHGVSFQPLQATLFCLRQAVNAGGDAGSSRAEMFFEQLSLGVFNAYLCQQTKHEGRLLPPMIMSDNLTGLYNRTYLEDFLTRESARAHRYRQVFCLGFLEIDESPAWLTTRRTPCGDSILQHFADLMRRHFRQSDVLIRLSHDRFAVVLVECLLPDAERACDRFRRKVASTPFVTGRGEERALTICGGLAQLYPGVSPELLLQRTQAALESALRNRPDHIRVCREW